MKITYTFVTGETVEVEVNEELGAEIIAIEHQASLRDRAETRRHESIDVLSDLGHQLSDPTANFIADFEELETEAEKQAAIIKLRQAMQALLPKQQELAKLVFFDQKSMAEIARTEGVSSKAIQDRVNKIKTRIRKIFQENLL